jgi:glycosyltransferase involved in cell wall biosynthesis
MKHKVAFFSQTIAMGGSEVYLRAILERLDYALYNSFFFCNSGHPLLIDKRIIPLINKGVIRIVYTRQDAEPIDLPANVTCIKAQIIAVIPQSLRLLFGTIKDVRRLSRLFREHPVDIFHFNDTGCEPATIAAYIAGIPRILGTYHVIPDDNESSSTWVHRLIEWLSVRSMHLGIAVSEATKIAWVKRTGLSEKKIRVIYNGIDFSSFCQAVDIPAIKQEMSISPEKKVIGIPARLHHMKGHKYLLDAVQLINDDLKDVVFLLIGDGELRSELESYVDQAGLNGIIRFLGHRSDVPRILSILDLVVLPSIALEALPFALIEAQASGKAVIASNFSGIPEIIENGVSGILVPPRDSKALAEAIMTLVNDSDLRQRMGEAGRSRAEQLFSLDRMLKETFQVYEDFLNASA